MKVEIDIRRNAVPRTEARVDDFGAIYFDIEGPRCVMPFFPEDFEYQGWKVSPYVPSPMRGLSYYYDIDTAGKTLRISPSERPLTFSEPTLAHFINDNREFLLSLLKAWGAAIIHETIDQTPFLGCDLEAELRLFAGIRPAKISYVERTKYHLDLYFNVPELAEELPRLLADASEKFCASIPYKLAHEEGVHQMPFDQFGDQKLDSKVNVEVLYKGVTDETIVKAYQELAVKLYKKDRDETLKRLVDNDAYEPAKPTTYEIVEETVTECKLVEAKK